MTVVVLHLEKKMALDIQLDEGNIQGVNEAQYILMALTII